MPDLKLISAAAVLTPSESSASPLLLRDSAILIEDGKIAAIGPTATLRQAWNGAVHTDLPHCVLTPGLVNAHCHLELSYMRGVIVAPADFGEWIVALLRSYPPAEGLEQVIRQAVRNGIEESVRSGVTTVGDISRHCALTRDEVTNARLGVVSFGEVTGLGWNRRNFEGLLQAAATVGEKWKARDGKAAGLSPHAPYTIEGPMLRRVVECGEKESLPLCMHLAELAEEREFLESLTGPLRKPYDYMAGKRAGGQAFDSAVPTFGGGPVNWAEHFGLLTATVPVLLAHGNYLSDEELDVLGAAAARRATPLSVVYCPRTRAYFGHESVAGPHRMLDLLARGVNVCLGTDSLASNPDLCLLREAQFLHRLRPEIALPLLFEMITLRGARALGRQDVAGSLAVGKDADILAFGLPPACRDMGAILSDLIEDAPAPQAVYIRGKAVG